MHTQKADPQLVVAARKGDQSAYDELFRRYRPMIRSRARSYFLAGAGRDDVVQEGNIGLCKAIWDYDPSKGASFHSFAELCVSRHLISAVKQAMRKKHSPLNGYVSLSRTVDMTSDGDRTLLDVFCDEASVSAEEVCLAALSHEAVCQGLAASLSKFEASSLRLFYNGRSYVEIALELGSHPKAVDNALQRAKRKLAIQMQIN